jgi:hypothetical protein
LLVERRNRPGSQRFRRIREDLSQGADNKHSRKLYERYPDRQSAEEQQHIPSHKHVDRPVPMSLDLESNGESENEHERRGFKFAGSGFPPFEDPDADLEYNPSTGRDTLPGDHPEQQIVFLSSR